jgi:hypothetical protein
VLGLIAAGIIVVLMLVGVSFGALGARSAPEPAKPDTSLSVPVRVPAS